MTTIASKSRAPVDLPEWLLWVGLCLTTVCFTLLAVAAVQGYWLLDAQGRPIAVDFVNVYAAGRLTLEGNAVAAYDWTVHKQAEIAAVGHPFAGYYGWHYPPTFLIVASVLALLPLVSATILWLAATLPLYVAAVRAIVPNCRSVVLLALGFPAVLWNLSVGQNGFLTAALIGGSLILVDRRPVTSGVLLGLLTYKPQFGILFPLALACGGHWRVMVSAAAAALTLAAASWTCFGSESWHAFIAWMPALSDAVLGEGRVGFNKLQTILGLARWLNASMMFAWMLHGVLVVACAGAIAWIWRSRVPSEMKAAALSTAAMLATPYLFIYDFVALAIPMAFLLRVGLRDGFLRHELTGLAAASLLVLVAPIMAAPTGLLAILTVAGLVGRRIQSAWLQDLLVASGNGVNFEAGNYPQSLRDRQRGRYICLR